MQNEKIYVGVKIPMELYRKVIKVSESEHRSIANYLLTLILKDISVREND